MISSIENGAPVNRVPDLWLCFNCSDVASAIVTDHNGYVFACDKHAPYLMTKRTRPIDRAMRITPYGYTNVAGYGLLHSSEITRNAAGAIASIQTTIGDRETFLRTSGLTYTFASGCAWRAVYIRFNDRSFVTIGIDPNTSGRPSVFGRLPWLGLWRVNVPVIRLRYPIGRVRGYLYKLQNRILCKIDGRGR